MKTRITWMSGLLGLAMAMAGLPAQATTAWSWNLNGTPSGGVGGSVSAYQAPDNSTVLSTATTASWFDGYGMGVCGGSAGDSCSNIPQHAMDNDGKKESLLLSFGEDVSLTSFTLGWAREEGTDGRGDVSVLAYTGSGTPIKTGAGGTTYGNMLSNGWTLIGSYNNVSAYGTQNLAGNVSSSYWLIAAYNSAFAGGCSLCSASSSSNDFVKLMSVAGTKPDEQQVPEPGSLLLVAAPMIVLALRRRRET